MNHSLMTKTACGNALKELMEHMPLNKIKVHHITDACKLNRQTFYYHFQDIFDLLGWIYKNEVVERIESYRSYETWEEGFLKIFIYIEENKAFCMNTFHSLGRDHLEQFLYTVTYDLLIGVTEELSRPMNVSEEDKRFIANYYTISFIGLVIQWMRNGMKEKPERLVKNLSRLIEGSLERGLHKFEK